MVDPYRCVSAATFLLFCSGKRLNTIGIRRCLQVNRSIPISIVWRDDIAGQVLKIKFLSQLLVELVDTCAFLRARLHVRCVNTLGVGLRRL